jgi:hypothetical protein
LNTTRPISA